MFLVTAGITGPGVRLCTTETWRPGELHWTNVGELPVKAAGIRAVSLDNRVFAIGDAEYLYFSEKSSQGKVKVGKKETRSERSIKFAFV